jgi:hypothetical protein
MNAGETTITACSKFASVAPNGGKLDEELSKSAINHGKIVPVILRPENLWGRGSC